MTLFNRTRTLSAACVVAVALFSGLAIIGCGAQRSEQYRQQGDTYLRLQKYPEAEEAYRNAIQTNPENAESRLGLGRCLVMVGKPEDALTCFQEAMRTTPQFDLAYLEAANLFLRLGNSQEALSVAQSLENVNPELGGVLYASLLVRLGRQAEAVASLKELRGNVPESTLVRTHLACALLAANQPAQAETELATALDKEPGGSTGASILMAEAMAAQGKIGEFIAQLEGLQTRNADQTMVLAYALLRGDREEEGVRLMRDALEQDSSSGWACFALGSYLRAKEQSKAASLLRTAANSLPWEPVVMRAVTAAKEPVVASTTHPGSDSAQAVGSEQATSATSTTEEWKSLWRQGALRRLLDERERFSSESGDHLTETLVLAAHFRGDTELAEELARQLPADSPLNAFLEALRNKDPKLAVDALVPWNEEGEDLQILAMNAVGHLVAFTGARGRGIQILSACSKRHPENGVSLLNIAQIFRAANMPKFAAQTLKTLTAAFPENIEAHILLFHGLREAGMLPEALQAAEVMYALFPNSREATLATAGVNVDLKRLEPARRVLEGYLRSRPDDPEIQLTHAAVLVREGKAEEALAVLTNITSPGDMAQGVATLTALTHAVAQDWQSVIDVAGPGDPESMALATRFILTAAYAKMGQKDKAAAILTQADGEKPFGGRVGQLILHALGHSAEKTPDAEQALSSTLASDVGALVDFASGAAYQMAKLHEEAYLAFRRVDTALAGDSDFLLGRMYSSLSNATRPENVGQEALAIAEEHATRSGAWLACASILHSIEDVAGERAALDKAAETGPENPLVSLQRGDFFVRQEELSAALVEYRRLLQLRPDHPIGNNNLAYYLLLTDGDKAEALKAAQLAAKGMPNEPRILHTLGMAQFRTGDLKESKDNLAAALDLMPGAPSLLLDYGQLLIELGDVANGRRHIESALTTSRVLGLDFDRQPEAEKILAETPVPEPAPEPSTSGPA
jgi:tetratricopeptide (TPR) repeat protein